MSTAFHAFLGYYLLFVLSMVIINALIQFKANQFISWFSLGISVLAFYAGWVMVWN
jgi:hypothetical protein